MVMEESCKRLNHDDDVESDEGNGNDTVYDFDSFDD